MNIDPSRACGTCGKAEGFSKSLWKSALFADFHRDGIFHRPFLSFLLLFSFFSIPAIRGVEKIAPGCPRSRDLA
jgi:hypothetical protein